MSTAETIPLATSSAPPFTLPVNLAGVPEYLKQFRQWVLWRWVHHGKEWTKVPFQPNVRKAETDNDKTFSSFDEVSAAYTTGKFDGIGFCFWQGDGLVGIDLDHCFTGEGILEPWAQEIVNHFQGTFMEKSPRGDGLHIWCLGQPRDERTISKEK